jgi:UDP-N-acetyl-D-glucosamine dehydrogenase
VPELPEHELRSVALDDGVAAADLVVLVTAHPGVDHEAIARNASRLLDLRGVTRRLELDTVEQL